jgi:hypothetical protein
MNMKMTTTSGLIITCFILVSLVACGGGGSSAPVPPTQAVIKLFSVTTGSLPAGTLIYGTEATVNLPAGVTVKASPSSANPQAMVTNVGVVSASGQAAGAETVIATYLASSTTPSTYKVELKMAKSGGFSVGEFAVLNCDITPGYLPAVADFTVTDFKTFDSNGLTIPGFTVGFTAAIQ